MRVKTCGGGVPMFKNMRLVILFDKLLNLNFKMTVSFATQLKLQLALLNLYTGKDFKSSGIGSLYEKQLLIFNKKINY